MALNIVAATDPLNVSNIITLIYGDPGIWKTSLAFTAKRPILFDFDKGAYRAANRQASVQIEAWHEVAKFSASDLADYDTIIVDTAGRALDMITTSLKGDSRNTRKDGQLSMQGYGKLGGIFTDWLKMLRGMGKDIVLLAHTSEDKDGDNIIKRPDIVGGSKREAYKIADMMAYMTTQHSQNGDVKTLNFIPHPAYLAKDSGQIGNITVLPVADAPTQLADIIQKTKDHINSFSEEAAKAHQELSDLRSELMSIDKASDFNKIIKSLDPNHLLHRQMKRDIWGAAQAISTIEFDETKKAFVDIDQDPEPKPEPVVEAEAEASVDNTKAAINDSTPGEVVTTSNEGVKEEQEGNAVSEVNTDDLLVAIKNLTSLKQGASISEEIKSIIVNEKLSINPNDLEILKSELIKAEAPLRKEYKNILNSIEKCDTLECLDKLTDVIKGKSSEYPDNGKHLMDTLSARSEEIGAQG